LEDEAAAERSARGRVVVIDDDEDILQSMRRLFDLEGYACDTYSSAVRYLHSRPQRSTELIGPMCILCDVKMPGMDGLSLLKQVSDDPEVPMVLMSGNSGAVEAVQAFRLGVVDFLIKPMDLDQVLSAVRRGLELSSLRSADRIRATALADRLASLTDRERVVVQMVVAGKSNPEISESLGLALRTVKLHRQRGMIKLGAHTITDLVRIADEANI